MCLCTGLNFASAIALYSNHIRGSASSDRLSTDIRFTIRPTFSSVCCALLSGFNSNCPCTAVICGLCISIICKSIISCGLICCPIIVSQCSSRSFSISASDICHISRLSCLLQLRCEDRNRDGHQDTDDCNNNQQLSKGEALLVLCDSLDIVHTFLPLYINVCVLTRYRLSRSVGLLDCQYRFLLSTKC